MKKIFLIALFLGAFVLNAAKLNIIVKDIQVGKGCILVQVYNNDKDFIQKSIVSKRVKASNECLDFCFDIDDGTYAVSVYQDINDNKIFDRTTLNIPTEKYGLSNNYRPRFSAPTFKDCKFKVTQQTTILITLK